MEYLMHIIKVTNIPRWISEIDLKNFFISCGAVVKAEIALDQDTVRSRGYGYVVFAEEEAKQRALEKNGAFLDGAVIKVSQGEKVEEETVSE